jgi:hypothetical protein
VVLVHTGPIPRWKKDNGEDNKGPAGPGTAAAQWLGERQMAGVGADPWAVKAGPGEHDNTPGTCHASRMTMTGIPLIETQDLEELAQDSVYAFAWSLNPLSRVGATGSPGNFVAMALWPSAFSVERARGWLTTTSRREDAAPHHVQGGVLAALRARHTAVLCRGQPAAQGPGPSSAHSSPR